MDKPIEAAALPDGALLARYSAGGAYTDCYVTDIAGPVTQAEYVEAFYTGAVFRLERLLLALVIKRPSTDGQAKALARGTIHRFAAWDVEARTDNQLLMCDLAGRTRSWLMTEPLATPDEAGTAGSPQVATAGASRTRLYFGSAVVPAHDAAGGRPRIGFAFRALLGFHRAYSRVLLHGARARLAKLPKMARPG